MDDDFKDKLRSANPIEEIIGESIELKRAGREFKACCPFHQEKTPSFYVIPDKQMYYCHGCHAGGDVFTFLMEHDGLGFIDACKRLAERANLPLPSYEGKNYDAEKAAQKRERKRDLYLLHENLATHYQKMLRSDAGRRVMQYAKDRGLSDDAIVSFGLGWAPGGWRATREWGEQNGWTVEQMIEGGVLKIPDDKEDPDAAYDRFRDRLMFPIKDVQGRVIGFSGRIMTNEKKGAKYLNTPETPIFHKGSILYGISQARQAMREQNAAILCEGQMDVIACHSAGLTHAVSPQGTAFTDVQAKLIKRFADNIIIAFDADKPGIKAAEKSREVYLPAGLTASVVLLGEGEDPDSLLKRAGADALKARLADARDYFDFLTEIAAGAVDLTTPVGKNEAAERVLKAVADLESPILRSEYTERVAARLAIPKDAAFAVLKTMRSRNVRKSRAPDAQPERNRQGQIDEIPPDYVPDDGYPPPFPARGPRPAGPRRAPREPESLEDPRRAPIAMLLEIAAHHEWAAQELALELQPHRISGIPAGDALNLLLAHTHEEEWQEGIEATFRPGETLPEILSLHLEPGFVDNREENEIRQALGDCLRRLRMLEIDVERAAVTAAAKAATDVMQQIAYLKQTKELDKERSELLSKQ